MSNLTGKWPSFIGTNRKPSVFSPCGESCSNQPVFPTQSSLFPSKNENAVKTKTEVCGGGSVKCWQAEELRLELLHAPESLRGLLGEVGVQVAIGNHHHMHPRGQRRLHAVGSVFKHQALRGGNRAILSSKPISSTGFHPCRRCTAEARNKHGNTSVSVAKATELTVFTSARYPFGPQVGRAFTSPVYNLCHW